MSQFCVEKLCAYKNEQVVHNFVSVWFSEIE